MEAKNSMNGKCENLLQKFSNCGFMIDGLGDVLMHLAVLGESDSDGNWTEPEWKGLALRNVAEVRMLLVEVGNLLSSDENFLMLLKWGSVMDEHYFKLGMVLDELVIKDNLTDKDCLEWICDYVRDAIAAMENIAEQAGMRFHDDASIWPSEMLEIIHSLGYIHTELQNKAVISDAEKIKNLAVKSAKTRVKMLELREDWRNDRTGFVDY